MKVCIVSWDNEAREVYRSLKDTCDIRYVIERDCEMWGDLGDGLVCVSFAKAYSLFKENEIDYFLIPCMRGINIKLGIYDRLIRNDIPDDRILYAPLAFFKNKELSAAERNNLICRFSDRREIDYLAMHIADGCNLNCAYCSVFSGLCEKDAIIEEEEIKQSVDRLSEIFDQVVVFRILGGEPLLHPKWFEICCHVKERFPLADIEIVTNGILLLSLDEEKLKRMSAEGFVFDLTDYHMLGDKVDAIHERLKRFNVRHYITQEVEYFSKLYDLDDPHDPDENYDSCSKKFMCMNMRGFYLSVCHAAVGLKRAAGVFPGIKFDDTGSIDIRTEGLTAKEIMSRLDHSHEMCKYCNQDLTKWHRVKDITDKKEWSV